MSEVHLPKVYRELWNPYRYKVLYGGRYAARSWTIARNLIIRATQTETRILCTRELQKSVKQSVHRLLKDQISLLGLDKFFDVQQQGIYGANGSEFMFLGIKHNTEEVKSTEGIDICWIEEAHNLTESSWDIIDPTIRKEDSEVWLSFNTRFKFDHVYQLFVANPPPPGSLVIRSSFKDIPKYVTKTIDKQIAGVKKNDYEKYLHVWLGNLKKLAAGAIFGKQVAQVHKDKRLLFIPVQKNCEAMTFFDLGKADETAIWFMQRVGREYHFIDYFQGRLQEVEYYTRFIRRMDYLYAMHYLPHDSDHERLGMKRNIRKQFMDGGVKPTKVVPRIAHKGTAIELARDIFNQCYFHKGDDTGLELEECDGYYHCEDNDMLTRSRRMDKGYETLCNYRYKYKEEEDVYQQAPHHDWASNGADAFMCFAQSKLTVVDHHGHDWDERINV